MQFLGNPLSASPSVSLGAIVMSNKPPPLLPSSHDSWPESIQCNALLPQILSTLPGPRHLVYENWNAFAVLRLTPTNFEPILISGYLATF